MSRSPRSAPRRIGLASAALVFAAMVSSATVVIGASPPELAPATSLGVASAVEPAGPVPDPDLIVSHFLCYTGTLPRYEERPEVALASIFGEVKKTVGTSTHFCNPVRKTRADEVTRIVDRDHHLRSYKLGPVAETDVGRYEVDNQFGIRAVTIAYDPVRLLVPTRKAPHDKPEGLDHYACSRITEGASLDKRVRLRDQFAEFRTVVRAPRMFCTPANKTHEPNPTTEVFHKGIHLVCYAIDARRLDPPQARRTSNQFERSRIRAEKAVMLCVPSLLRV